MWSDNDIDNVFQRLNPSEPEPVPFPLDAWLRLETQLDKAVIERTVRHKLWRFFAAEVAVVALVALGWLLWPAGPKAPAAQNTGAAPAMTGPRAARATAGALTQASQSTATQTKKSIIPQAVTTTAASATTPVTQAAAAPVAALAHASPPTATPAAPKSSWLLAAITPAARRGHGSENRPAAESKKAFFGSPSSSTAAYAAHHITASAARTATSAGILRHPVRRDAAENGGTSLNFAIPADNSSRNSTPLLQRPADRARTQRNNRHALTATQAEAAASASAAKIAEHDAANTPFTALAPLLVVPETADIVALPASLATVALTALPAKANEPIPNQKPRFYIGLAGAPDVTTVKFASIESPLPNVGLTLEYRLSNRLRVITGVLRSTKQYMARRDDYDWGTNYSRVYQRNFEEVNGSCTVLDIPLNLRYAFLISPHYQLFSSIGLSSFFMQREHYSYDYVENSTPKQWNGEAINQNRHLLSILNLSFGYERSLSNHWSVQAEPYLKVPLAGVGTGKVQLTSAGVLLGVKYGL